MLEMQNKQGSSRNDGTKKMLVTVSDQNREIIWKCIKCVAHDICSFDIISRAGLKELARFLVETDVKLDTKNVTMNHILAILY